MLNDRLKLKLFIKELFTKEGFNLRNITYIFCSDKCLLNINQQFLSHDYYTDIITFDLSETSQQKAGEVYISVDRVKDNAEKLKISFTNELHRVIFHGALHLCDYEDKTRLGIKKMRISEDKYLRLYFSSAK